MTALDIVRAAKPEADEQFADFILWARTPFPCAPISARRLYKAASGFTRATAKGIDLCTFCEALAADGDTECARCAAALQSARTEMEV